jgi:HEPN domain-containing protein
MDTEVLLNDFATRSFRNIADYDYIAARLSYRYGLIPQFHWQALQALEKYLKSILLYNRIKATNINHDLDAALTYTKELPFTLDLSDSTIELIKYLSNIGRFRYLEISYLISGPKLVQLDKAVWEIRRYCKVINYELSLPEGGGRNMLCVEIDKIKRSLKQPPHKFKGLNGELEKILNNKEHSARPALIWQNGFFSTKTRTMVKSPVYFQGINSPLFLHPEILDEVLKYVFIPKNVVNAYKEANK